MADKNLVFEAILHSSKYTAGAKRVQQANANIDKSFKALSKNDKIFNNLERGAKKVGNSVKDTARDIKNLHSAIGKLNGQKLLNLNQKLINQKVAGSAVQQAIKVSGQQSMLNNRQAYNQQYFGSKAGYASHAGGVQAQVSNVRAANQLNVASTKFAQYQQLNQQRFQNQMAVLMQKQQNMLMYNRLNSSPQGIVGMIRFAGRIFAAIRAVEAIINAFQIASKAIITFASNVAEAGMKMEKYELSLNAVASPGENKNKIKEDIINLAKLPGIGIEGAFEGYNKLRFGGASNDFALRALAAFSKGNAISGGGKDEFKRVIYAVSETMNKPFAQAQELFRQLEFLPIRKVLKEKYGVSTTQELKEKNISSAEVINTLVSHFEKLSFSTDSFFNSWENMSDNFFKAATQIGRAMNTTIQPMFDEFGMQFDQLLNSGFFSEVGTIFGESINTFMGMIQAIPGGLNDMLNQVGGIFGKASGEANKESKLSKLETMLIEVATMLLYSADQFMIAIASFEKVMEAIYFFQNPGRWVAEKLGGTGMETNSKDAIRERLTKALLETKKANALKINKDAQAPDLGTVATSMDNLEKATNQNTRAIEKANSYADRIIGGGSVGKKGISGVELANIKNTRIKKAIQQLATALDDSLSENSLNGVNYMSA